MENIDSELHAKGKSVYVDDIPEQQGCLYAAVIFSAKAHARILNSDFSKVTETEYVLGILTADDIKGKNQIGGIIADEPLLAEDEVHFIGQPIAVVVAKNRFAAKTAAKLAEIEYKELDVLTSARKAKEFGQFLFPARTFANGDLEKGYAESKYIFSGQADSGAQEHLYLETQGAYAVPLENNNIKIFSSTQSPTQVQKTAARVLNLSMHNIEVDVTRLGGGFGGKEDQATPWAAMAAMAVQKFNKPVKLILDRHSDILVTGKRHPYSSDFKIGLDEDYNIRFFEVEYLQNGGAATDLSPAIMERTLFHVTNAYYIPNVKATAYSCKTNLVPFTAFRGFGAPQAVFVIESAIALAAEKLNIDKAVIQQKNLIKKGDTFHYGQICNSNNAVKSLDILNSDFDLATEKEKIEKFNDENIFIKKGFSIQPVCFGISFTKTSMNQARALIHIYQDGSIGISTGAIEMGQGVNTKLMQVAADTFSVGISRIKIESTNTTRVANTSPTAASSGADLNGHALLIAAKQLLQRLIVTASEMLGVAPAKLRIKNEQVMVEGKETGLLWKELVNKAFLKRVKLSETGHYATPKIYFNKDTGKGHAFAYHVFGTAYIAVKLDCLTGTYKTESVNIVHDFGNSLNLSIDIGQVEGGVVQGIGWMTNEEMIWDKQGRMLANSLSNYKVPDIFSAPETFEILQLETEGPELALLKSKAIGEPPFLYGIGVYFALQNAIKAFNNNYKPVFDTPLTPEKVLKALYRKTEPDVEHVENNSH
ncbi:MAG: molybdopterin cofactor-binding domain-containing protein [Bacteroidota bacterium]